jgi:hypothetical protein
MLKIILRTLAVLGIIGLIPVLLIILYLANERNKEMRANITKMFYGELVDLSEYYMFTRICVFPKETYWYDESYTGYAPVDEIFPDSHIYWTIILVDDTRREYRILIVDDRKVIYAGERFCSQDGRFAVRHTDRGVEAAPSTAR